MGRYKNVSAASEEKKAHLFALSFKHQLGMTLIRDVQVAQIMAALDDTLALYKARRRPPLL